MKRGSGFQFINQIKGGVIPKTFILAAETGIKEAMENGGSAGYPIVDIKVTMYDGSYHEVDSSELAFKIAGSMALKSGVSRANPVIIEPVMRLEVVTPEQFLGEIIGDLSSRRGHVEAIEARGETSAIRCLVPLAETFGYATTLRSLTQGRATYSMEFCEYQELPTEIACEIKDIVTGRKHQIRGEL